MLLRALWYGIPVALVLGVWTLGVALYGFDWGLAAGGGTLLGLLLAAVASLR